MDKATTARLNTLQMIGIGVGVIGVVIGLVGAFTNMERFLQIYLISFQTWTDMTLGCLGFFLLLHLVDGKWGFLTQRIFAAGARVMPLMAILFLPILFQLPALYPWAGGELTGNGGYDFFHSLPFFSARVILYFVVWIGAGYMLSSWSYQTDKGSIGQAERDYPKRQRFAAGTLLLYFITVTLFTFDMVMSITPEWFSTIFGWLFVTRQAILAMMMAIIVVAVVSSDKSIKKLYTRQVQNDLGTLIAVTLLAWIYMTVIQYFIMWSGNQPSKIKWFVPRTTGEWEGFVVFFAIAHAVPLFLLLTPTLKRYKGLMLVIAGWLMLMRIVEMFWLVIPTFSDQVSLSLFDLALPIGIGGLWLAAFAYNYKAQPLVPDKHPHYREMLAHETPEHLEGSRS